MELLLNKNNLYSNAIVIEDLEEGNSLLLRDNVELKKNTKIDYHIVKDYDRIDLIAYKYYKNIVPDSSKYWWLIADVNNILNPLDLSDLIGVRLIIPNLSENLLNV